MPAKISRRQFRVGGGATAVSAIFLYSGGWWFFKVRYRDSSDFIAAILHKKLSFLQLEEDGVQAFAKDYDFQEITSWAGMAGPLYRYFDFFELTPRAEYIDFIEDRVVLLYLLSTDFFLNDADESLPVKYLGYFDPYRPDYRNTLARF